MNSIAEGMVIGNKVYEGQIIGESGNSGQYKTKDGTYKNYDPHLHIDAVDKNGQPIDPENRNYGRVSNETFFNTFKGEWSLLLKSFMIDTQKLDESK